MKLVSAVFLTLMFTLTSFGAQSHGLISTTAKVEVRPNNLVELQVQFDFIALLNHRSKDYQLPVVATLSPEKYGLLYQAVTKLFDQHLEVSVGGAPVKLNRRYPSRDQMFEVTKRQFIESSFSGVDSTPYTFSDRRFYQRFFFDFKVSSREDINKLVVSFPKELGGIYVSFVQPVSKEVHSGEPWKLR
ncbi:hypothetical protein MO867_19340 [Microbulbifer sp. OS29]|uniref:DUF4390 domain-containing protein n=1 Tax=Microbulbifer okhotskensis TaxID=2926617 RepID=A0A9X2ERK0_9GAMM|nr:hypothetical protein [Microbulbifer okhotskensis]MCO1336490.1 hypothetical protein [Microbulbifer okhotskensis]